MTLLLSGDEQAALRERIRVVHDWPQDGVVFQDLSGVLADPVAFSMVVDAFAGATQDQGVDVIVGIEARGFAYGAALAHAERAGFVAMRKPGKLPGAVHAQEFELEYGTATLELHTDAVGEGHRVLIVDDVLATGGTAVAAVDLVRRAGATVVGFAVVMEIPVLGGRARIEERGVPVLAILAP